MEKRKKLRIGIPRVLNMYIYAPLFNAYFESLGVQPENIIYSDYTSSELYRAGASRGAIDPCFPAKIGISHVHNLIQEKHRKKPLERDLLPDVRRAALAAGEAARASNACPTVTATPETVKAAFTKENDVFAEHGVKYLDPVLNFADRKLFALPDVPGLASRCSGLSRGGKRSRDRSRASRRWKTTKPASASARARCSISWSAKTASASSCWAARIITIPA